MTTVRNNQEKFYLFLGGVIFLSLWSVITYTGMVNSIFLPSPTSVAESAIRFIVNGKFFESLFSSLTRVISATFFAAVIGVPFGIFIGFSYRFEKLTLILVEPMRYLPITALLPLMILWFGIGETMKVMFLFFGIVFYLIPLIANSVRNIKIEYRLVASDLGLSPWETVRHVIWPAALPQIWESIIIVNGIGWTYVVLAEIINAKSGLGYLINISGRLQRSADVFAGLFFITLVALSTDRLLRFIQKRYFNW